MLVRAHVRSQAPLPTPELGALKVAVGQLSALGRRLDSMRLLDRSAASDAHALVSYLDETATLVKAVRREVADIVRNNLMSWECEDA